MTKNTPYSRKGAHLDLPEDASNQTGKLLDRWMQEAKFGKPAAALMELLSVISRNSPYKSVAVIPEAQTNHASISNIRAYFIPEGALKNICVFFSRQPGDIEQLKAARDADIRLWKAKLLEMMKTADTLADFLMPLVFYSGYVGVQPFFQPYFDAHPEGGVVPLHSAARAAGAVRSGKGLQQPEIDYMRSQCPPEVKEKYEQLLSITGIKKPNIGRPVRTAEDRKSHEAENAFRTLLDGACARVGTTAGEAAVKTKAWQPSRFSTVSELPADFWPDEKQFLAILKELEDRAGRLNQNVWHQPLLVSVNHRDHPAQNYSEALKIAYGAASEAREAAPSGNHVARQAARAETVAATPLR